MRRRGAASAVWWWGLVLLVFVGAVASLRVLWPAAAPVVKPLAPAGAALTPAVKSLPEEDRKAIWYIEHQGLVLKKRGFSSLKSAMRNGDKAALLKLLAADFEGQALNQPREIALNSSYVKASRQEEAGDQPRQPLTGAEFVERLLEYRRRFVATPELELALMTLSPQAPDNAMSPWKGEVQLRMWGGAGVEKEGRAEVLLSLQFRTANPSEETLSAGRWLHGCALRQTAVSEAPRFLLKDVTAQRGIDTGLFHDNWTRGPKPLETVTGGVYLTDFDRDGCLDMLIVDLNRIVLYKGMPDGRFVDVTAKVGLPLTPEPKSITAAVIDLDGDGWEDLIIGRRIFTNVSDGKGGRRFDDSTVMTNLQIPTTASAIIPIDYDRDGRMDLYVTRSGQLKASSWVDGKGVGGGQLWRNTGKGLIFEEVTAKSGASAGQRSVFSAVCLDADNDGWPDLFATCGFVSQDRSTPDG
jgi:FG-GAP-like repeat